jgi:hypothetical protein
LRHTIERYVRQEKTLIKKASNLAAGMFKGTDILDMLNHPKKFQDFMIEKAVNRYVENVLPKTSQIGLMLSESLKDMSNKEIKKEIKIGDADKA